VSSAAFDTRTLSQPKSYRILACVDGSALSEECLPHALALARAFRSELTIVRVMEPRHEHSGPQLTDALAWELSRQEATAYLERIREETASALGRSVEVRLEQGRPPERIVELAREIAADLTVLGRHGEGGVSAWHLGSTAQQVLAVPGRSVLVVGGLFARQPAAPSPRRILVALDGSVRAESALPTATRIARAHGAELLLVHIVREPLPTSVLRAGEEMNMARQLADRLESAAGRYLERLRDRLAREGDSVRVLVARDPSESEQLLAVADHEDIDLIVLSAHGSGCHRTRPFGSVTSDVVRASQVPVMVLQDLPAQEGFRVEDSTVPPPLRSSFPPEAV
jgi:nucleotide-binding universal stress UspA family protein